ncbi:hypothetical protein OEZ86_011369 [Tetradesmus obliquus]|nr:hypothetical protein OEZ86_011369 [Tetradesmus obliquus]
MAAAARAAEALTSEDAGPPVQPQLVDQFIAAVNSGRRQQLQQRKVSLMQEYARAEGDVGSPEVQIALLTDKIRDMSSHFLTHKKDYHGMRGLQGMLNQRRKLLAYLRRDNFPRYAFVLHKLGLKDTYAKQARYDKYRVGSRLGAPAEALKRYGNQPVKQLSAQQKKQQQKQLLNQQQQQQQQQQKQQKQGTA